MVFISYGSCDRLIAEELTHYLEEHGIRCWITLRDLTSGNFSGEITRALRACEAMVVICSNESCKSEHVKNEVTIAFNQRKHIVPYLLDENPFDDDLEYFLSLKQHIKTRGSREKDYEMVAKFLHDYLGHNKTQPAPEPAPAPKPAPAPVPAAKKEASAPRKKSAALPAAIVAAVLVLGGAGAFFLLKKPASEPVAAKVEQPAAEPQAQQPVAQPAAQASAQPAAQPKAEQPKTQPKATAATTASASDTFSGDVVNGYPDGFGTYTFKTRRRIDMHDAEERYAEAGDYIKGDWKNGHLNYGEWYSASGTKKAFIQLGDNPDHESDQKLGKCKKR